MQAERLIKEAGVGELTEFSTAEEQAVALSRLGELATGLEPLDRELLRNESISALKTRKVPSAARLVDAVLKSNGGKSEDGPNGRRVLLADPALWDASVDGPQLLEDLTESITRYLVIPRLAAVAVALWVLHTHVTDAAHISPRLAVLSPTKRCGKTTLLKLLHALVSRPLSAANLTTAVLFRSVEAFRPTLLVDEADTFLQVQEELRGVLNAGHDRGSAVVMRCVGDDHEPRQFNVWAPVALAGIGRLPDTLIDRSLVITMKRKADGEEISPLRRKQIQELNPLSRRCVRWSQDNLPALRDAEPEIPDGLNDRAADNWEPLLAIADRIGGAWPKKAREAASYLTRAAAEQTEEEPLAEQALRDIRSLFEDGTLEPAVSMKRMVEALVDIEGRPWSEVGRGGKPLTTNYLGKLLRRFNISSKPIRTEAGVAKGYRREWFEDAFSRYIPLRAVTSVTDAESLEKLPNSDGLQTAFVTENNSPKDEQFQRCNPCNRNLGGVREEKPSDAHEERMPL